MQLNTKPRGGQTAMQPALLKMSALVKGEQGPGITLRHDMPIRDPGPNEVQIQVAAAGICGSDFHIFKWDAGRHPFSSNTPFVQGHEGAGVVVKLGPGVTDLEIGQPVALESHLYDQCDYTARGLENVCPHKKILGIGTDGVFAQFVNVPSHIVRPLPDNIPLDVAAIFEPATIGLRVLETIQEDPRSTRTGTLLILGATGVMGAVAALAAKHYGYNAVAVARDSAKLAILRRIDPGLEIVDTSQVDLMEWAKGKQIDKVVETTGHAGSIEQAMGLVANAGIWIQIGLFSQDDPVFMQLMNKVVRNELHLLGVVGRTTREWHRMINLVGNGQLNLAPLITHRYTLDQAEEAFQGKAGIKSIFVINQELLSK